MASSSPGATDAPIARLSPAMLSLTEVAKRLGNERINRLVAEFREPKLAIKRMAIILVLMAWTLYWAWGAPARPASFAGLPVGQILPFEALRVLPVLSVFLVVSIVWMVALRLEWVASSDRVDAFGALANILGIGTLMSLAFNLLVSTVTLMPMSTVLVGTRFGRRAAQASTALSVVLVAFSPPQGLAYWIARPGYAVFALVLLIATPMVVQRLLAVLYEVSMAALHSRDAQARFLATMSHELRTPLNTVVHAANLIDTTPLSSADHALIDMLNTNAAALLHRVNEVLDVAAIQSGRLLLIESPFALDTVLPALQSVIGNSASARGVTLKFEHNALDGLSVVGDIGRVEQVLTNLTTNAIRFTPPGGSLRVELVADAYKSEPGFIDLTCTIADTGVGISDADKERIFAPFEQISNGPSRERGGFGLGLYIVQTISERLGGKFSVSDTPGGGATFTWRLSLPRAAISTSAKPSRRPLDALEAHRQSVPPLSCLVVDDNSHNLQLLTRILNRAGHSSLSAQNGPDALRFIEMIGADVVFLDLHMPHMTGWEVLDRIVSIDVERRPKVVIVSADSDPELVDATFRRGAFAYIVKPIAIETLLNTLSSLAQVGPRVSGIPMSNLSQRGLQEDGSSLSAFRSMSTPEAVRDLLCCIETEIIESSDRLSRAILDSDTANAVEHLHDLKNSFLSADCSLAAQACSDLSSALRTGGDVIQSFGVLKERQDDALQNIRSQPEYLSSS